MKFCATETNSIFKIIDKRAFPIFKARSYFRY